MNTLITAHSGAEGTPPNSIAFLQKAFCSGADILETDIRLRTYPDGGVEPVLSHEELTDDIPYVTLREAFSMMKAQPDIRMNCDLKEDGLEESVYLLAKEMELTERILYTGSVSVARMREKGLQGRVEVCLNIEEACPELKTMEKEPADHTEEEIISILQKACSVAEEAGISSLNMPECIVNEKSARLLRERGMGISAWTVDDMERAAQLLRLNISNITTNHPARVRAIAKQQ